MQKAYTKHVVVLAGYLLLALFMTMPLVAAFTTHVAGVGGDPWQTMWRFEEKTHLLFDGSASSDFIGGAARLVNLSVWPWIWTDILFGQPAGYNLVWLLSFLIAGYGMYLLVSYLQDTTLINTCHSRQWHVFISVVSAGYTWGTNSIGG